MSLECIHWWDHNSYTDSAWRDNSAYKAEPISIFSIGWVVDENKDALTLISTETEHGRGCGDMTIIKKAIVKRWKIKDPTLPTKRKMAKDGSN